MEKMREARKQEESEIIVSRPMVARLDMHDGAIHVWRRERGCGRSQPDRSAKNILYRRCFWAVDRATEMRERRRHRGPLSLFGGK